MSWTTPGQGYNLQELNEALGTIRLGQLKNFMNKPVPFVFKRTSGKDGGVQEYDLIGTYKGAMSMTINEPKKLIQIYMSYGDGNLDDMTTDMFPKKYHDANDDKNHPLYGFDWGSQKLQTKFFDDPMMKEITKAVKSKYPKFKLSFEGG